MGILADVLGDEAMSRCVIVSDVGARLDHTPGNISIPDSYAFFFSEYLRLC